MTIENETVARKLSAYKAFFENNVACTTSI